MARGVSSVWAKLRRGLVPSKEKSTGHLLRNAIHTISSKVHPYAVKVIPNFRAAHYTYILFMSFFTSVIVFPISDFKYVDILFLMCGSSTQAGLNTINLNDLRLSQQIIVYITTTLTTPIFIHGSLLFVRLYWFERYFDDIKESSKLNFKMRRNATLAARTRSMDRSMDLTNENTVNNQGLGFGPAPQRNGCPTPTPSEVPPPQSGSSSSNSKQPSQGNDSGQTVYDEPSDDEDEKNSPLSEIAPDSMPPATQSADTKPGGIKFAEPSRPTKRTQEIDPSDMYKSIALLQKKRRESGGNQDVLVIKSPGQIERERNTPIFTTKASSRHFSPSRKRGVWKMAKKAKLHKWETLKQSISNSSPSTRKKRTLSFDDDTSIDSESDEQSVSDRQGNDDEDSINSADGSELACVDSLVSSAYSGSGAHHVEAESNNHGNMLENDEASNENKNLKFAQDPTIDREKLELRRRGRRRLRKLRTPLLSLGSRTVTDRTTSSMIDASDEEINNVDSNGAPLSKSMSTNYLSWTPTVGRNSNFVHLTDDQKEELGGVEYCAIKLLIKIIVCYYIGFHIIAFCIYVGFISVTKGYAKDMRGYGISPTWWGFFTAQSVFNDLGLTLTPNSMYNFSRSIYILILSCFFIVIGNTGFPILLRFIIWILFKTAKPLSLYRESLGFLLDHPRRCFTLLFPSVPTWWLFFILVVLNATDLILFIILDLNKAYLQDIPLTYRVLDGLFQAFSTRTAGFTVIDLSQLHAAVQVSYMIMMYISVLPLAISIRRTNVYEEQSLGVYLRGEELDPESGSPTKNFIGTHLRNQLSFDLWFIFLGLFVICIAEGNKLEKNDSRFTIFAILFEIISAYGTVGLSLGYPNVDQSLSYEFTTISKLVIIAMMIRGRHRGLPYSLDRAIMLPNDQMEKRDVLQENHAIQLAPSLSTQPSRASLGDQGGHRRSSRLGKTISRVAGAYRRNSLFPEPTRLPDDLEMRRLRSASR